MKRATVLAVSLARAVTRSRAATDSGRDGAARYWSTRFRFGCRRARRLGERSLLVRDLAAVRS